MASSAVDVYNLALSHLGVGVEVAEIDEASAAAEACTRFYDTALEEMLRDFVWPFATKVVTLGLVTTNGVDDDHPSAEYTYAYRYPSDCLMLRKIQSGIRNDNRQSRIPFRLIADDVGSLILTDYESAVMEYTSSVGENPARWPSDFTMAFSYRLAAYIAPRVTAGDPYKMGEMAGQMWKLSISKARANAGNEEQDEDIPDGELIRARD